MTKIRMFKTDMFEEFEHLNLEFVSKFDIRISNLKLEMSL